MYMMTRVQLTMYWWGWALFHKNTLWHKCKNYEQIWDVIIDYKQIVVTSIQGEGMKKYTQKVV